ncbi:MAG: antiterminator LoaP [Spirochaetota bacterium]
MLYYAIQDRTTGEDEFIRRAVRALRMEPQRFFAPKRVLKENRKGKMIRRLHPVFPGYVFFETESLEVEDRWKIRRIDGFFRFLNQTSNPLPLSDNDRQLLLRFISFGKVADISKVTFDENQRIVVLEGPLKGLEGRIVKVDRRRGRAKVSLDICETGFLIDFGFEAVTKVAQGPEATHDGTGS